MATDRRSRRVLVVISTLVIALLGVAIVLALRAPPEFDPLTPEGTAQGYLQAVLDGDEDVAFSFLTETLQDECTISEMRHAMPGDARIVIKHTEIDGADAELELEITETHAEGPFDLGASSYSFDETLVMERRGDRWLIADVPWPTNIYCHGEARP